LKQSSLSALKNPPNRISLEIIMIQNRGRIAVFTSVCGSMAYKHFRRFVLRPGAPPRRCITCVCGTPAVQFAPRAGGLCCCSITLLFILLVNQLLKIHFVAMEAHKNVKLFRVHCIKPTLYSLTIMVIVFLKARTEQKKSAEKKSKNYS
jgi:hypothetical protein